MSQNNKIKCSWAGIGIIFEENSKIFDLSTKVSQFLNGFGNKLSFGDKNKPHLNLYDLDLPKNKVATASNLVDKLEEEYLPIELEIEKINFFNFGLIHFKIKENKKLNTFHQHVVESVSLLRGGCLCQDYLDPKRNLNRHQKELLQKYGNPFVLDQFNPHITLGLIPNRGDLGSICEKLNQQISPIKFKIEKTTLVTD